VTRRRRAGEQSSDSDASREPQDELASSHSSDDDEFDVRGAWSKSSAKPSDVREYSPCCWCF